MSLEVLLEEFNVTKEYGFLVEHPLTQLPPQFSQWKEICDALPDLIDSNELRRRIDDLEVVDTIQLKTHKELRLAHLQLISLAAGYIWHRGAENAPLILPRGVSIPLYEVSQRLQVPPVISHATACLANWTYKGPSEERPLKDEDFKPEDLELVAFRMLKTEGNSWFFLLTARIEKDFSTCVYEIVKTCHEFKTKGMVSEGQMQKTLTEIQASLKKAIASLGRMREHLEPSEFYHQLRKFLWGYNEGALKTDGIIFQGADAEFLASQRAFMPKEHRDLLDWVAENSPIKEMKNNVLVAETKKAVKNFRSAHLRTTTNAGTGTGGTPFMHFLKKVRDDSN